MKMRFKRLALAVLLTSGCLAASAEDLNEIVSFVLAPTGNLTASFPATHRFAGSFVDTFDLGTYAFPVTLDYSFTTRRLDDQSDIDFQSLSIIVGTGPQAVTYFPQVFLQSSPDVRESGRFFIGEIPIGTPITLRVIGIAGEAFAAGTPLEATFYNNTVNVTPVPEPRAGMMMLAGLAAIGWLVRRRSKVN